MNRDLRCARGLYVGEREREGGDGKHSRRNPRHPTLACRRDGGSLGRGWRRTRNPLQLEFEVVCGLDALVGIFIETKLDDAVQPRRSLGAQSAD